jgi:hypothetical protein
MITDYESMNLKGAKLYAASLLAIAEILHTKDWSFSDANLSVHAVIENIGLQVKAVFKTSDFVVELPEAFKSQHRLFNKPAHVWMHPENSIYFRNSDGAVVLAVINIGVE